MAELRRPILIGRSFFQNARLLFLMLAYKLAKFQFLKWSCCERRNRIGRRSFGISLWVEISNHKKYIGFFTSSVDESVIPIITGILLRKIANQQIFAWPGQKCLSCIHSKVIIFCRTLSYIGKRYSCHQNIGIRA